MTVFFILVIRVLKDPGFKTDIFSLALDFISFDFLSVDLIFYYSNPDWKMDTVPQYYLLVPNAIVTQNLSKMSKILNIAYSCILE